MKGLEALRPEVGEPLDYVDCLLLGLWRRLDAGQRTVPRQAMELLEVRLSDMAAMPSLRDRSPQLWVGDDDVEGLLAGIFLLRIAALRRHESLDGQQLEEELLAGEGLTLALLIPRIYYSGSRLLAFMRRAQTASVAPETRRFPRTNARSTSAIGSQPRNAAVGQLH